MDEKRSNPHNEPISQEDREEQLRRILGFGNGAAHKSYYPELHKKLKEQRGEKELLQKYLDITGVMIVVFDTDGNVNLINRKGCELLGHSHQEIVGKKWGDVFLTEGSRNEAKVLLEELISGERSHVESYEQKILSKTNKESVVIWFMTVLKDDNGATGIIASGTDITALKESERDFKGLFENSHDAIIIFVPEGEIVLDVNQKACEMYGYSRQELIGMSLENVTKEIRSGKKQIQVTVEKGFKHHFETVQLRKDRTEIYLEINASIVNYQGQHAIQSVNRDVTKRKIAEIALRESEERYRSLYNHAPLGYQSLNKDGRILDVNPAWLRILGYKKEDVIGKWFGDFLHPDYLEHFHKSFAVFKRESRINDVQFEMIKKDGSSIYVSYEGEIGSSLDGEFKQTYCTFKDITDERIAKKALIKAKEQAEENELHSKIIAELSKEIIQPELSIKRIAGLTYDYVLKLTKSQVACVSLADVENRQNDGSDEVGPMTCLCEYTGKTDAFSEALTGNKDLWKQAQLNMKPFFTNDPQECLPDCKYKDQLSIKRFLTVPVIVKDEVLGQISVANKTDAYTDVDVKMVEELANIYGIAIFRKRIENDVVKAKERAEESDRLKSAFLANMSHEIRTPMNGILGFADLLKEPQLNTDEKQKYIQIIEKSGARMLNIINDLINISKIEAGQMETVSSETNVNEQLDFLFSFFKPEFEEKGLNASYHKALPDNDAHVHVDREKLYAILTNLLKNAIKYTSSGGIKFGYLLKEGFLEFYIEDTGIGVALDRQKAIFDRFVQADLSISKPFEGAGLGLSITKAYVEMIGGEIAVSSSLGQGSRFSFTVPYNLKQNPETKQKQSNSGSEKKTVLWDFKILIVEDDESAGLYLSEVLKTRCKKILHAKTGLEAIDKCMSDPDIALVLMDIKMPSLDGYGAVKAIREFNQTVVIIAQTAYALAGDREKAIAVGCNDYIAKPILKNKLFALIEKYNDVLPS
jgi:PAS domain S-box-containing protein